MKSLLSKIAVPLLGLPSLVYSMSLAAFVSAVGRMGLLYVALYLAEVHGFDVTTIGWLIAAAGLGSAIGAYGAGLLSDLLPPSRVLVASLVTTAAGFVILNYPSRAEFIAPVLLIIGIAEGGFRPAYHRIVISVYGPDVRARACSIYLMAVTLAFAIAGAVGGLLASHDYTFVFLANVFTSLAAAVFLSWLFAKGDMAQGSGTLPWVGETSVRTNASPYRDPIFAMLCLSMMLCAIVHNQLQSTYPLYLNQAYHLSVVAIGPLFLVNGIMVVGMQVPMTWMLQRISNRNLASIGIVLLCGGFAVLPLGSSMGFALLSLIVWTMGEILLYPPLTALVMARAERGRGGHYLGIYHSLYSVALLIAPAIGGSVYGYWGAEALWFGCGLLGTVAAILIAVPEKLFSRAARPAPIQAQD